MNFSTYYIQANSNQFSLTETLPAQPIIFLEKQRAFQIFDNRPFLDEVKCDLINCGCRINSFVWISHAKKAIYFENPKAGSSSIKASLNMNEPDLITCLVRIFSQWHQQKKYAVRLNDYSNTLSHEEVSNAVQRLNDIVSKNTEHLNGMPIAIDYLSDNGFELYFGDRSSLIELFPSYFAFSFSRDPFDRFISNYLMFIQKNYRIVQLESLGRKTYENLSLHQFINLSLKMNNHHWNNQSVFIPENISDFKSSFIGKLENFHDDWKLISEKLEVEFKPTHKNKTEQEVEYQNYPKECVDIITQVYQEDFNRFYKP